MKENKFIKSLILHIRYPWTAICLLILWVGMAIMCAILKLLVNEVVWIVCATGVATLVITVIGFRD